MRRLSLVAASGGHSSSRCAGLSLSWPLLLWSTGSRCAGSVIVAHGPSCSAACGIFPDRGLNPCSLHWQADSQPLRHQGSPLQIFKKCFGRAAVVPPTNIFQAVLHIFSVKFVSMSFWQLENCLPHLSFCSFKTAFQISFPFPCRLKM